MDTAENHRHLTDPAWRRWTLLAALLTLGSAYIFTYVLFNMRSSDYILAKRNEQASQYSLGHMIETPASLSIGLGKPDFARLGGGWHIPEVGGVWSADHDAWIDLFVREVDGADLQLRFNTTAFVAKRHPSIRISLSVNGVRLASWRRDSGDASEPLDVRVPRSAIRNGWLSLDLHIDHGASPADARVGPDRRQLGISLSSIEIKEVR